MHFLVIGGYRFLGRAIIDGALARGHRISAFNRGALPLPASVEHVRGERDDPSELAGRAFDAIIDTSGYVPRHVRAAAEAVRDLAACYVFVSSVSVYAQPFKPGMDESAPRETHPTDADPDVYADERYGALKALCEDAAEAAMPGRTIAVRAGFIVGPHDYTDRFPSWVRRAAESEHILVPGEAATPMQLIDVRDLAAWIISAAEQRRSGPFNVTGPFAPMTVMDMAQACIAGTGSHARAVLASEETLHAAGFAGWNDLPFWFTPELYGMVQMNIDRAIASGLSVRPLEETVRDTLAWLRNRA